MTKETSADCSFALDRRYATAHIVCSEASANKWSSTWSVFSLKYFRRMVVSARTGSCSFHSRKYFSCSSSTVSSHCCPSLLQIVLSIRLISTVKGANSPIGSNTDETWDRTLRWVIGWRTSFFVPRQTCSVSSSIDHCNPKTEGSSAVGSTSIFFTALFERKSSGINSLIDSSLLIHFFNSKPCFDNRGCSWRKICFPSSTVWNDLMKSSI